MQDRQLSEQAVQVAAEPVPERKKAGLQLVQLPTALQVAQFVTPQLLHASPTNKNPVLQTEQFVIVLTQKEQPDLQAQVVPEVTAPVMQLEQTVALVQAVHFAGQLVQTPLLRYVGGLQPVQLE